MKKYLIALLVMVSVLASAQTRVYVTGNAGVTVNFWKPNPFNDFIDSFHNDSLTKPNIKTPFSKFGSTVVGFSRGIGILSEINKTYIGFEFNKSAFNQTSRFTYTNNNGRELTLRFVTWNFNFDISRKIGKHLDFGLLMGVSLRSGKVKSYTTYANSDNRSLGAEIPINGIYQSMVENDFNIGLSTRIYFLKYLALQIRAYKAIAWANPDEGEEYLSAFTDDSPGKNLYSTYFPKDYTQFNNNIANSSYDYETNVIPNIFAGWYLQTSLIVKVPTSKKK